MYIDTDKSLSWGIQSNLNGQNLNYPNSRASESTIGSKKIKGALV